MLEYSLIIRDAGQAILMVSLEKFKRILHVIKKINLIFILDTEVKMLFIKSKVVIMALLQKAQIELHLQIRIRPLLRH